MYRLENRFNHARGGGRRGARIRWRVLAYSPGQLFPDDFASVDISRGLREGEKERGGYDLREIPGREMHSRASRLSTLASRPLFPSL